MESDSLRKECYENGGNRYKEFWQLDGNQLLFKLQISWIKYRIFFAYCLAIFDYVETVTFLDKIMNEFMSSIRDQTKYK